jgi:hypothetical protein
MRRATFLKATLIPVVLALSACAAGPSGWTSLINGEQGLDRWNRIGDANWHAESGAIVADQGKGGLLVSPISYRDFEIRAEFWAATDTNSGIFIRVTNPITITSDNAYEVNIWDIRPDPTYGTGAIVSVAPVPVPPVYKAGGQWNTLEIRAIGPEFTVRFNGVQTAQVRDNKHTSGPIALQYGAGVKGAVGGPIKWRKVEIRPL